MEQTYRESQRDQTQMDMTMRSTSYSTKMKNIRDRSKRHANNDDVDQIYSSDISAIKKLKLVEQNAEKFKDGSTVQSKDENFAG